MTLPHPVVNMSGSVSALASDVVDSHTLQDPTGGASLTSPYHTAAFQHDTAAFGSFKPFRTFASQPKCTRPPQCHAHQAQMHPPLSTRITTLN